MSSAPKLKITIKQERVKPKPETGSKTSVVVKESADVITLFTHDVRTGSIPITVGGTAYASWAGAASAVGTAIRGALIPAGLRLRSHYTNPAYPEPGPSFQPVLGHDLSNAREGLDLAHQRIDLIEGQYAVFYELSVRRPSRAVSTKDHAAYVTVCLFYDLPAKSHDAMYTAIYNHNVEHRGERQAGRCFDRLQHSVYLGVVSIDEADSIVSDFYANLPAQDRLRLFAQSKIHFVFDISRYRFSDNGFQASAQPWQV